MLLHPKALVVALFLSTKIVLGAPIERSEKLRKRDQLEGISISFDEDRDNWQELATDHSFAYIVATGGYGKRNGTPIVPNVHLPLQATRTPISPHSSLKLETLVSFVVLTTLRSLNPSLPVLIKLIISSPTVGIRLMMEKPCRVPSKLAVGLNFLYLPIYTHKLSDSRYGR